MVQIKELYPFIYNYFTVFAVVLWAFIPLTKYPLALFEIEIHVCQFSLISILLLENQPKKEEEEEVNLYWPFCLVFKENCMKVWILKLWDLVLDVLHFIMQILQFKV